MNTPLIKWTGSKRHIAKEIISHFPRNIETYYEPFLGGGSVFFELLKSDVNVRFFRLSDKNESLIEIFKIVKDDPQTLISSYQTQWELLQEDSTFYYSQRDLYNETKDPLIFYFLTRTCYNGTIRYNSEGRFNTSHHFNRTGMLPRKVEEVINYYSNLMKGRDIEFYCTSFEDVNVQSPNDVVYIDPPYTNSPALYFGNINLNAMLEWINGLGCNWFMNLNQVNKTDNEEVVNISFTSKTILRSGNSSFSRMKGKIVDVGEYFYWRYA